MIAVVPYGQSALLIECAPAQVAAVTEVLSTAFADLETVPAARTVLLRARPGTELGRLEAEVKALLARPLPRPAPAAARTVEIPVRYDGPDLEFVAEHVRLSPAAVVAAHTAQPWRVAFGGFAPGFAYLDGGDPRLSVPRHPSPRTMVPAGAVALAGEYSGVYPRPSPGGWQLIGHTDLELWDPQREPPALLRPGWWVQFVEAP